MEVAQVEFRGHRRSWRCKRGYTAPMDFDEKHPWRDAYRSVETFADGVAHEGVGGIVGDMPGAVDRLVAEQQLRSRIDIVDGETSGPRLPNQVTRDEFHQAAHDFSDVRLGRGNLRLAPDPHATVAEADAFTNGAMVDVAAMLQTSSGRQEVSALSHNDRGHTTTIEPNLDKKTRAPLHEAVTPPADSLNAVQNHDGTPRSGSDAHIHYNPGVEAKHSRSDVVLSHEMRHALDETHGNMDNTLVDKTDGVPQDLIVTKEHPPVMRYDHQALGIGKYTDEKLTENHYRQERQEIGSTAGPDSVLPGDKDMPLREYYNKF
jgi:hypothetical protein